MTGLAFTPSELILRPMRSGDLDRVTSIAAQSATAPHWHREAYEDAVTQNAATIRLAQVAELHGEAVGFVIANVIAGEAEIESIAVATEWHRRGVATSLLHRLIADLRVAGVSRIVLEVRESNISAQRLYARAGFEQAGRRRGYYQDPDEDALVFNLLQP